VRSNPLKFGIWFFFQAVTVWVVHLPITILNSHDRNISLSVADFIGWGLWFIGLICETASDQQKFIYKNNPSHKDHWCDKGVWKYSRHPNYFGEICCWWGIFMSCAVIFLDLEWFSIISPLSITLLLMFGSGIPTTEKSTDLRFWENMEYQNYKKKTPILIPFFPGFCTGIPKMIFCCEWKIYEYPPETVMEISLP